MPSFRTARPWAIVSTVHDWLPERRDRQTSARPLRERKSRCRESSPPPTWSSVSFNPTSKRSLKETEDQVGGGLDLSDNQLTSLPLEMLQLTNLKKLDLRRNPLPVSIRHRFRRAPLTYLARYQEDMVNRKSPS